MLVSVVPGLAFASARPGDGYPLDLNDNVVLSVYKGNNGSFPGEPNTHMDTSGYVSFNDSFNQTSYGSYSRTASSVLTDNVRENVIQGSSLKYGNSTYYVWGVFDTSTGATSAGLSNYFIDGENNAIFSDANETKMIMKAWNISESEAEKYEIVWYVVKYQTSDTAWHIDGMIRERNAYSVNYYGNGSTSGGAPLGSSSLAPNTEYTILGNSGVGSDGDLERVVAGVPYTFIGWNTKADGSGSSYQPGDKVILNDNTAQNRTLTLYAQWQNNNKYKATVNLFLDNEKVDLETVHDDVELYISKDKETYIPLAKTSTGTYEAEVTSNGAYALWHKEHGEWHTVGNYTVPIYNSNGALDINHYSINYHSNGGALPNEDAAYKTAHFEGSSVKVIDEKPNLDGKVFIGWNTKEDGSGTTYLPGSTLPILAEKVDLYAQWIDKVDASVNVTIKHGESGGYDNSSSKHDLSLWLASRDSNTSPYLEMDDCKLELTPNSHEKHNYNYDDVDQVTTYTANVATFTDLLGGSNEYTVVTNKTGYDLKPIQITQDANGDWIIDIELFFNPENFNIEFELEMDDNVPSDMYPDAAIVKVTTWDGAKWNVISEQANGLPGVRVDITGKTGNKGTYSVWKYVSGSDPVVLGGYRILISSFVYDGKIVPASSVIPDTSYSDNVYTASVEVTDGKQFGSLFGAYCNGQNTSNPDDDIQDGSLKALITMDLYKVTFDAQGGTINGNSTITEENQYKVPVLDNYVPTGKTNYVFDGWYLEPECKNPAKAGEDLTQDLTLYAKWKEPLTIKGSVTIEAFYEQNGSTVIINEIDRADKATILLERIGSWGESDSCEVSFTYDSSNKAVAHYEFEVPDDGTKYELLTRLNNYSAAYDNEPVGDGYVKIDDLLEPDNIANDALFNGDSEAVVNIYLDFVPGSFEQEVVVDASQIAENFRPTEAVGIIFYRDIDDNHPFKSISQHDINQGGTGGNVINLENSIATGTSTQNIWKYHTDESLYEYALGLSKVYGNVAGVYNADGAYDEEAVPFKIDYSDTTTWSTKEEKPIGGINGTGVLQATITPKSYTVSFDLAGGTMSAFAVEEEGVTVYKTSHTWSFETDISSASPTREAHAFLGWYEDLNSNGKKDNSEAYVTKVGADIYRDVALVADWTPTTTPIIPGDSVNYIVEHYKANADGSYPSDPSEKETLGGKIGASVTGVAKDYEGYCLNEQVSTLSGTLTSITKPEDILVLKLYYDADATEDDIPDKDSSGDNESFEKNEASENTTPKTADSTPFVALAALVTLAASGAAVARRQMK